MHRCMSCMVEVDQNVCPHCGYARGTAPREAFHLIPESILAGRYIVGKVLGFGGFGVTYIGYDAQLERVVAIKEFFPTSFATRMPGNTDISVYGGKASEQFGFGLERFIDEAKRLARFNGVKGITDIYDTFVQNNTAYIIMEFLKGHDVKQILSSSGRLDYETARKIILSICDTLAPVHAENIIHRDISPDNIYILDSGEIKLLDFGAARYESSANSKSLSVILKSGYAPEEQYRARGDQGSWTDVYALAATFYKMLTGVTPPDSMERAINDEIKEPSKLGATLPQSAENAIMNALNVRKEYRTATVDEFKNQLLSDGVERTKIKKKGANTGKMPLVGKIVIGVAALSIVSLVVLQLTGVTDITMQEGDVLPSVNITGDDTGGESTSPSAPAVIGLAEETAVTTLTEAGYTVEFEPKEFSDGYEAGTVMTQSLPDENGVIYIKISDGGIDNAAGMDVVDAAYMMYDLERYMTYFVYELSDTVPAGQVIKVTTGNEGYNGYDAEAFVTVSLGARVNASENTEEYINTPVLFSQYTRLNQGDQASYNFALFAGLLRPGASYADCRVQFSTDGVNYEEVDNYGGNGFDYTNTTEHEVENGTYNGYFDPIIYEYLYTKEESGTVHIRLVRLDDNDEVVETLDLAQKIHYNFVSSDELVKSITVVNWDTVDGMIAAGEVPDYYSAEDNDREGRTFIMPDFDFNSGFRFLVQGEGFGKYFDSSDTKSDILSETLESAVVEASRSSFTETGDIELELIRPVSVDDIIIQE